MSIDTLLGAAVKSKQYLEDFPNDETEQDYAEARGAFRTAIIEEMRVRMGEAVEEYLEAAAVVSEVYEKLHAINGWFVNHGIDSPLKKTFLKEVKLPVPVHGMPHNFCGTEVNYLVTILLSEEGEQVFEGNYSYYDDHERMPPAPGAPTQNESKEFNGALGR